MDVASIMSLVTGIILVFIGIISSIIWFSWFSLFSIGLGIALAIVGIIKLAMGTSTLVKTKKKK